jgi:hypothetical protein
MGTSGFLLTLVFHLLPNLLSERKQREIAAKKRIERDCPLFHERPSPFPSASCSHKISVEKDV